MANLTKKTLSNPHAWATAIAVGLAALVNELRNPEIKEIKQSITVLEQADKDNATQIAVNTNDVKKVKKYLTEEHLVELLPYAGNKPGMQGRQSH
jgi:hypothetical protein